MSSSKRPCSFTVFGEDQPAYVEHGQVRTLSSLETKTIFHESFAAANNQASTSREVLKRLQCLSPTTASIFDCKVDRLREFVFRLIFPNSQHPSQPSSFLSLSYCWPQKPSSDFQDHSQYPTPIPPLLFAAVIKELKPTSEGIWCDQICINQENNDEKSLSIGMMDLVYKEARRTVIALADIEISKEEQSFLESYLQNYPDENCDDSVLNDHSIMNRPHMFESPPYFQSHPLMCGFYYKIISSRWWQRAWCAQEMRLGQRQIFLVPCENQQTVLRMTARFFAHLMFLACEIPFNQQAAPSLTGLQWAVAQQSLLAGIQPGTQPSAYLRTFSDFSQLGCGGDPDPKLSPEQRIQSAMRDRMAINLNTNDSGFILTLFASEIVTQNVDDPIFTNDRCYKMLALLSLAEQDPTILCTTGKPIPCSSSGHSTHSWIWQCTLNDISYGLHEHIPEEEDLKINIDENDTFIELEMCDLHRGDPSRLHHRMVQQSGLLINGFRNSSKPQRDNINKWKTFSSTHDEIREIYMHTLACILQCGIPWILSSLGVSEETFQLHEDTRALLSLLEDLPPPWLQTTSSVHLHEDEMEAMETEIIRWIETDAGWKVADCILSFAAFTARKGLPAPRLAETIRPFSPRILCRSNNRRHIVFWNEDYGKAKMAVPKVLLDDHYQDLHRVWLLERVESEHDVRYHNVGRLRIFGPSIADSGSPTLLRVYGPKV